MTTRPPANSFPPPRSLVTVCHAAAVTLLLCHVALADEAPRSDQPRFNVEVMAAISKAGCNLGACHGNASGKGGLKLSLRGEDSATDYNTLVRDFAGRRVNVQSPEESLLLLEALGRVPHQGGIRFSTDSPEYRIFQAWLSRGALRDESQSSEERASRELVRLEVSPLKLEVLEPAETVQLRAVAHFASGEAADVTPLACYETSNFNATVNHDGLVTKARFGEVTVLVRFLNQQTAVRLAFLPARPDFVWSNPPEANLVDTHVFAKLRELRMNPSPLADDSTFLRRVYLDCIGVLPTIEEAQAFVADSSPDKRSRLIDALLQRPEFTDFWTLKWSDLLRNEENVLDARGVDVYYAWIHEAIAEGRPVNEFVRELVSSRGSTYEFPAANYYRASRDPFTRSEATARLFLGVRLQCARCHNHPFDRWTQDDYYNWAAWFAQIDYQIIANKRADALDKNSFNGEQIVIALASGDVKNARTGNTAMPKFLGAATPEIPDDADRTTIAAQWLTSPENDLFVASQVNFVWNQLLGRGLVEPFDDIRATNPASHPELLAALGKEFVASKFDLRHLVRVLLNSRTYQLSSAPNETNASDDANYAHARVRRLTAEQLVDAQSMALGVSPNFPGYPEGTRAVQLRGTRRAGQDQHGPTAGDRLLKIFGKPERLLSCDCERTNETNLSQALVAISDEGLQQRLSDGRNRLRIALNAGVPLETIVDDFYWAALARGPTAEEQQAALSLCQASDDPFAALQDVAWAVLNAKEFMFRH